MKSATFSKSLAVRLRDVNAGVPIRNPLGLRALLSPGHVFLFNTMDISSSTFSPRAPSRSIGRRSRRRRWVSVPPVDARNKDITKENKDSHLSQMCRMQGRMIQLVSLMTASRWPLEDAVVQGSVRDLNKIWYKYKCNHKISLNFVLKVFPFWRKNPGWWTKQLYSSDIFCLPFAWYLDFFLSIFEIGYT